jgi:hypothetical protein
MVGSEKNSSDVFLKNLDGFEETMVWVIPDFFESLWRANRTAVAQMNTFEFL